MISRNPRPTIAIALCLLLLAGCAPSERETAYLAKKALLERQNKGIRELIALAKSGPLVPPDQFLIGVDENIAQSLFRTQLPIERPVGKRFTLHLEKAEIHFRDKYGEVVAEGYINRNKTPDRKIAVRVHGGLGAVEIDPKTDLLTIRIAVDDLELVQAGILEGVLGTGGKKFLATKGREYLKDALPPIQIPVGLAREIRVPSIRSGAVQLDSLVIPIDVSVERVLAARQKLWVTLNAQVGTIEGGEQGLGVKIGKKKPKKAPASSGATR